MTSSTKSSSRPGFDAALRRARAARVVLGVCAVLFVLFAGALSGLLRPDDTTASVAPPLGGDADSTALQAVQPAFAPGG